MSDELKLMRDEIPDAFLVVDGVNVEPHIAIRDMAETLVHAQFTLQRLENIAEALRSRETENVALRTALRQAEEWFADYADRHRAKGDDDKATRNQERADFCRRAADHSSGD